MLWATRCKVCDAKVRINAFWATIFHMIAATIFVFLLILTVNYFWFAGIIIPFLIYLISLFAIEIIGPLVVSAPPRNLNVE